MQDIVKILEKIFYKNNKTFFSYAWREKITNILTTESRYCKLLDWINERIQFNLTLINVFNPADRTRNYTKGNLKTYLKSNQELSVLLNIKSLLIDDNCTTQMRDNLEYTICKLFNIKYSEDMKDYV